MTAPATNEAAEAGTDAVAALPVAGEGLPDGQAYRDLNAGVAKRWYSIQVFANFENKVAESIRERAKVRGLSDLFEEVNAELGPGYILVKMELTDEACSLIKNIPKVIRFEPVPISEAEIECFRHQVQEGIEAKVSFVVGEQVLVSDGTFAGHKGTVEEVDERRSHLKVAVPILGTTAIANLEFSQVARDTTVGGKPTDRAPRYREARAVSAPANKGLPGTTGGGERKGLAFHPLADLFPLMSEREYDELEADVATKKKLHDKITLLVMRTKLANGEERRELAIIDGRNRYRACLDAGLFKAKSNYEAHFSDGRLREPYSQFFNVLPENEDPLAFVLSRNLKRRHLNEGQRAMVADNIATMRQGERTDLQPSANLQKVDRPTAAKMLSVSERSVASARTVHEKGAPSLVRAVEQGKLAVSEAAKAAKLAPAEQERVAQLATEGKANVVRTVIKQDERQQREAALGARQAAGNLVLPQKRYGVILADPEWRFEPWSRETGLDRSPDNHYPTSVTEVIAARPVQDIAAKDCVLFLWATVPMLPQALLVMGAWGFDYRSNFVWAKDRSGTGYWNRNRHEHLLLGVRGDVPAPAPGTQWHSLIEAAVGEHSEKPESFYALIEGYFPSLSKIELNARRARPGWDRWGAEAPPDESGGTAVVLAPMGAGSR
jgi:N6-adenosine-specific RNA methylase IME4/transcription antitermination factor NusG